MIRFITILLLSLGLLWTNSFSQPKLEMEGGKVYDWGDVKLKDSPLKAKIKIYNKGNEKLKIYKVKPACGCTTAPLDKEEIEPGDYATLDVTLNLGNHSGLFIRHINITSNAPDNSPLNYQLKCNIIVPIKYFPSQYISFGMMELNKEATAKVVLTNSTDTTITIKNVIFSPENMIVNLKNDTQIPPKGSIDVEAKYLPKSSEPVIGWIRFQTDNPEITEAEITIRGIVKDGSMDIAPPPLPHQSGKK
ncbi:MAG: DUF1573 domain-containing protein [Candidatus Kapabacteria bacterium]|nr:DUF1573 domain-containing protein [Candidatus Kapabacteria bacterium]